MNIRIVLAAALILTGGSYTSHAQQKTNTAAQTTAINAKTFEAKIKEYQKTTDAGKSASLLAEMKQQMVAGMSSLKAKATSTTDKAAQDKMMEKFESRRKAVNEVIKLSRGNAANKQGITDALKQYAQTL